MICLAFEFEWNGSARALGCDVVVSEKPRAFGQAPKIRHLSPCQLSTRAIFKFNVAIRFALVGSLLEQLEILCLRFDLRVPKQEVRDFREERRIEPSGLGDRDDRTRVVRSEDLIEQYANEMHSVGSYLYEERSGIGEKLASHK